MDRALDLIEFARHNNASTRLEDEDNEYETIDPNKVYSTGKTENFGEITGDSMGRKFEKPSGLTITFIPGANTISKPKT